MTHSLDNAIKTSPLHTFVALRLIQKKTSPMSNYMLQKQMGKQGLGLAMSSTYTLVRALEKAKLIERKFTVTQRHTRVFGGKFVDREYPLKDITLTAQGLVLMRELENKIKLALT